MDVLRSVRVSCITAPVYRSDNGMEYGICNTEEEKKAKELNEILLPDGKVMKSLKESENRNT